MATQEDAIKAVQDKILTVSGINAAPDYAPEQLGGAFPFSVAYPSTGNHSAAVPGVRKFLGSIIIEIHVARKHLPTDIQSVIGFGDSIPAALLADPTLGGVINTFSDIDQEFVELNWGDTQTLGYRFTMNGVKIETNL